VSCIMVDDGAATSQPSECDEQLSADGTSFPQHMSRVLCWERGLHVAKDVESDWCC
jgi:hypothetical protein